MPRFRPARSILVHASLGVAAVLVAGCGKATVRPVASDPGFSMARLRADTVALSVAGHVRITEFKKTVEDVFGSDSVLGARLSARLLDSMTHGTPAIVVRAVSPAVAALWPQDSTADAPPGDPDTRWRAEAPRYVVRVYNLTVGGNREPIPAMTLPSGPHGEMAPASGGENVACVVGYDVEVWETVDEEGLVGLRRRTAFTVTGRANVVLFAHKMALEEALAAALRATLKQLRQ